jgi:hypothetical protein
MPTEEIITNDIITATEGIAAHYELIEKGFTFLRVNKIEPSEDLIKSYNHFDEQISNIQSAIARQIYGND